MHENSAQFSNFRLTYTNLLTGDVVVGDWIGGTGGNGYVLKSYPISQPVTAVEVYQKGPHGTTNTREVVSGFVFHYGDGSTGKIGPVDVTHDAFVSSTNQQGLKGFDCNYHQAPHGQSVDHDKSYWCIPHTDFCTSGSVDNQVIPDLTVSIGDIETVVQNVDATVQGVLDCGPRIYSFDQTYSFLRHTGNINFMSGNVLTLTASDPTLVGSYPVQLTVELADYPSWIPMVANFNVHITCTVTSMTFTTAPPATHSFMLEVDPVVNFSFVLTMVPACIETPLFSLVTAPPFVSTDQTGTLTIDPVLAIGMAAGDYSFDLNAELHQTGVLTTVFTTTNIVVTVVECLVTSISFATTPPLTSILKIRADPVAVYPFALAFDPPCFAQPTPTFTLVHNPPLPFLKLVGSELWVDSSQAVEPGTFSFSLQADATNGGAAMQAVVSLSIEVIDLCANAVIFTNPEALKSYRVEFPSNEIIVQQLRITTDVELENPGVKCELIATLEPDDSFVELTSAGLTVRSSLINIADHMKTNEFQVKITSKDFPDTVKTMTLNFHVNVTQTSCNTTFELGDAAAFMQVVDEDLREKPNVEPIQGVYLVNMTTCCLDKCFNRTIELKYGDPEQTIFNFQQPKEESELIKWLKFVQGLLDGGLISRYDHHILMGVSPYHAEDQDVFVLNMTGDFEAYFQKQLKAKKLSAQTWINQWRKGVASKRAYDALNRPSVDTKPLVAEIISIDKYGLIVINFSEEVRDLQYTNWTDFTIDDAQYEYSLQMQLDSLAKKAAHQPEGSEARCNDCTASNSTRRLQLDSGSHQPQIPSLELFVLPGEGQEIDHLGFSWNATYQKATELKIQIHFDSPEAVSNGQTPDKIQIRFNDPMLFYGASGKLIDDSSRVIERSIRPQIGLGFGYKLDQAIKTVGTSAQTVILSNFVMNFVFTGAMNMMWSMIETQQIIALLLMFNINAPANAVVFFAQILEVAAFEFFEVEPATNYLLNLKPTGALTNKLDQLGMQSLYFFNNLGSLAMFFVIYMINLLVLPCLRRFCKTSLRIKQARKNLERQLVWGYLITAIKGNAAIIAICVFINFKALEWSTVGAAIHNSIAILFLLLIGAFPLYSIWWLYVSYDFLCEEDKHSRTWLRFGKWVEGLKVSQGRAVLTWPAFFMVRRLLLAAAVVFLNQFVFQTLVLIIQVLFSIIFSGNVRPWEDPKAWMNQIGDEFLILLVFYHLMCFTPFLWDYRKRYFVGYSVILIVSLHFVLSILNIVYVNAKELLWQFKLWRSKKLLKEQALVSKGKVRQRKFKKIAMRKLGLRFSSMFKPSVSSLMKPYLDQVSEVSEEPSIESSQPRQSSVQSSECQLVRTKEPLHRSDSGWSMISDANGPEPLDLALKLPQPTTDQNDLSAMTDEEEKGSEVEELQKEFNLNFVDRRVLGDPHEKIEKIEKIELNDEEQQGLDKRNQPLEIFKKDNYRGRHQLSGDTEQLSKLLNPSKKSKTSPEFSVEDGSRKSAEPAEICAREKSAEVEKSSGEYYRQSAERLRLSHNSKIDGLQAQANDEMIQEESKNGDACLLDVKIGCIALEKGQVQATEEKSDTEVRQVKADVQPRLKENSSSKTTDQEEPHQSPFFSKTLANTSLEKRTRVKLCPKSPKRKNPPSPVFAKTPVAPKFVRIRNLPAIDQDSLERTRAIYQPQVKDTIKTKQKVQKDNKEGKKK